MRNIPWKGIVLGCLALVGLIVARSLVTIGKDMYFGYDWWFHLLSDPWFYVGMVAAAAGLGALVAYGLENKKTQQDPQ